MSTLTYNVLSKFIDLHLILDGYSKPNYVDFNNWTKLCRLCKFKLCNVVGPNMSIKLNCNRGSINLQSRNYFVQLLKST